MQWWVPRCVVGLVDMSTKLSILFMMNPKLCPFAYVWIQKMLKIVIGLEAQKQHHILMHVYCQPVSYNPTQFRHEYACVPITRLRKFLRAWLKWISSQIAIFTHNLNKCWILFHKKEKKNSHHTLRGVESRLKRKGFIARLVCSNQSILQTVWKDRQQLTLGQMTDNQIFVLIPW